MKNILTVFAILFCGALFAINPTPTNADLLDKFNSDNIDTELTDLQQINQLVIEKDLNFNELSATHADMVAESNLSNKASGIFDGHPDNPLGIPGFWWGFCLGWVGMLIMYLTMDEGAARKEQVKNALYGCIIFSVLWIVLWFAVFTAAAT